MIPTLNRQGMAMGAVLALFGIFLILPLILTLSGGFESKQGGFTAYHILEVFRDPLLRAGLVNSLWIAIAVTGLCLVISLPLAFLEARTKYPGQGLLSPLLLVPLILPPFVGAIGFRHIFGRTGSLSVLLQDWGILDQPLDLLADGGWPAVVLVEALHLYPIVFLNATAALANIDPALEEAAQSCSAGRWARFRRILLPLLRPGLFAGCTIVFIWSFTELGTPLMFDMREVTSVQIFDGLKEVASSPRPYALASVMLGISMLLYLGGRRILGREIPGGWTKSARGSEPKVLRGLGGLLTTTAVAGFVAFAAMPHLGVLLAAAAPVGGWYESILPESLAIGNLTEALQHPTASTSIRNSLGLAAGATMIDVVLGFAIAWLIVRTTLPGRQVLDALSMLPLAVPGLVMAFGFVALSLRWPFNTPQLEPFFDILGGEPNPIPLLVIAYAVRRLPYVVRSAAAGLQQTGGELEEAAFGLGANRVTVTRLITLPLITANLAAGALLAFAFAMLEVSDSIVLAQREAHYPVTKAIAALSERLGDGPSVAAAMGAWGMLLLALALFMASRILGSRLGAIFRA